MNWIFEEAKKADPTGNRVILENSKVVAKLDNILINTYYPPLKKFLDKCGYAYAAYDAIPLESGFSGPELNRKLTIMLFDELRLSFFRGYVSITENGYLLNREFFLTLPEDTNLAFIKKILSDKRFTGNYPVLHMEQGSQFDTDFQADYSITIEAGNGFSFGQYNMHTAAINDMLEIIQTSIKMFELSQYGFDDIEALNDFLELAYTCYEAC